MSDTEYLCKDCKHCFINLSHIIGSFPGKPHPILYECRKSLTESYTEANLVIGKRRVPKEYESCMTERILGEKCGPEGRQWAPKHKKDLFKMLTKEHK